MKEHEQVFFALCYKLRHVLKPRDIVIALADTIPHKRCWYYLEKWLDKGFYDYGVTLDLGWFYLDKIPPEYLKVINDCKEGDG